MIKMKIIGWLFLFLSGAVFGAKTTLYLDTNLAPPYQVRIDGLLKGRSIETLDCLMDKMGFKYNANVVPWKRAQNNLQFGRSDGMFSVMHQPVLDSYAVLSAPMLLEKWFWFSLNPDVFKRKSFPGSVRIGVLRGSNQEEWLFNQLLPIAQSVNQMESLVGLLRIGRIDVALIDRQVMDELMVGQKTDYQKRMVSQFVRYSPLGVYFSKSFLKQHDHFMERFNELISQCNVSGLRLSSDEQAILTKLADRDVASLLANPELISQVEAANQRNHDLTSNQILGLDSVWMKAAQNSASKPDWMQSILSNVLSKQLQNWQQQKNNDYAEVFVSDARGLLVATSKFTSDYMQGDEEKFNRTMQLAQQAGKVCSEQGWMDTGEDYGIGGQGGSIDFDESTLQFLSHISYPIWSAAEEKPIGVLTLGINVEFALRNR